jgi:hypothetical protein
MSCIGAWSVDLIDVLIEPFSQRHPGGPPRPAESRSVRACDLNEGPGWWRETDLVDEMNLLIVPVVVGQGARLFPGSGPDIALDLVDSRALPTGITMQVYRPAGRQAGVRSRLKSSSEPSSATFRTQWMPAS